MMQSCRLNQNQSLYLDATRGIAALMVFLGHWMTKMPETGAWVAKYPIQQYGVVIFFFLSGFLIAYQRLLKGSDYTFEEYTIDRFARIYTSFIPALLLIAIVDSYFALRGERSLTVFIANAFMYFRVPVNSYVHWWPIGLFPRFGTGEVFWTIVIEWWLYMGFGLVFNRSATFWGRLIKALVLIPAAVILMNHQITLIWVLGAASALLFVVGGNRINETNNRMVWRAAIFSFSGIYILFEVLNRRPKVDVYHMQFGLYTCLVIGAVLFLFQATKFKVPAKVVTVIKYLSLISYPLYLIHLTLLYAVISVFGTGASVAIPGMIFGLLATALFTKLFETRYSDVRNWLKRNLIPSIALAKASK